MGDRMCLVYESQFVKYQLPYPHTEKRYCIFDAGQTPIQDSTAFICFEKQTNKEAFRFYCLFNGAVHCTSPALKVISLMRFITDFSSYFRGKSRKRSVVVKKDENTVSRPSDAIAS